MGRILGFAKDPLFRQEFAIGTLILLRGDQHAHRLHSSQENSPVKDLFARAPFIRIGIPGRRQFRGRFSAENLRHGAQERTANRDFMDAILR